MLVEILKYVLIAGNQAALSPTSYAVGQDTGERPIMRDEGEVAGHRVWLSSPTASAGDAN